MNPQFAQLLQDCQALILYQPLPSEPDFHQLDFFEPLAKKPGLLIATLPGNPDHDPFELAEKLNQDFQTLSSVLILVPGKEFDLHGSRRGRGYGWYDRLLSAVPGSWLRVGICHHHQLCLNTLERKPWDQPVSWLIVVNENKPDYKIYQIE